MPNGVIQSRQYRELRAELKAQWRAQGRLCALGGHAIDWDGLPNEPDSFELDHIISRKRRPDLALEPSNYQPSCVRCNRSKGAGSARPAIGQTSEDW